MQYRGDIGKAEVVGRGQGDIRGCTAPTLTLLHDLRRSYSAQRTLSTIESWLDGMMLCTPKTRIQNRTRHLL
jgi:hypothetical protein